LYETQGQEDCLSNILLCEAQNAVDLLLEVVCLTSTLI